MRFLISVKEAKWNYFSVLHTVNTIRMLQLRSCNGVSSPSLVLRNVFTIYFPNFCIPQITSSTVHNFPKLGFISEANKYSCVFSPVGDGGPQGLAINPEEKSKDLVDIPATPASGAKTESSSDNERNMSVSSSGKESSWSLFFRVYTLHTMWSLYTVLNRS